MQQRPELGTTKEKKNTFNFLQMSKSSSNLNEIVYSGRPKNEEPHVKKSVKRKSERIEYIVRVDLVRKLVSVL